MRIRKRDVIFTYGLSLFPLLVMDINWYALIPAAPKISQSFCVMPSNATYPASQSHWDSSIVSPTRDPSLQPGAIKHGTGIIKQFFSSYCPLLNTWYVTQCNSKEHNFTMRRLNLINQNLSRFWGGKIRHQGKTQTILVQQKSRGWITSLLMNNFCTACKTVAT